jgi:F420-dependent oxidoreductase-like protein
MAEGSSPTSLRDRVGLVVAGADSRAVIERIVAAEAAGVPRIWMTQGAAAPDTMSIFAAAAVRTTTIGLGTAIVPTYPRHPITLAQQALTIADLAPGRLRLGVGPSHRPIIEGVYGLSLDAPMAHLREYVAILRDLLHDGKSEHQGEFYRVRATLPRPSGVPILISALRAGAFQLSGEISDGALSWLCPPAYLLGTALPALQAGAKSAGRPAPPLVAHVPVALSTDRAAVAVAAQKLLGGYARLPFYAGMFTDAGFPPAPDGSVSQALIDGLVVSGDEAAVTDRLRELLDQGLDELLIMPVPIVDETAERERVAQLVGRLAG